MGRGFFGYAGISGRGYGGSNCISRGVVWTGASQQHTRKKANHGLTLRWPRGSLLQEYVSAALKVPRSRIACYMKRAGGAFGGKVTKPALLGGVAAVAANK